MNFQIAYLGCERNYIYRGRSQRERVRKFVLIMTNASWVSYTKTKQPYFLKVIFFFKAGW